MPAVSAYGLVAKCNAPVARADVERMLADLVRSLLPDATVAIGESTDHGSLVSGRPERFAFFNVDGRDRAFCLCRFRHFEGGFELVFNLSDSGLSSREIDHALVTRLPVELVRQELL